MTGASGAAYTLGWLLQLLEHNRIIDNATHRDLLVRGPEQGARFLKQKFGRELGGEAPKYTVSPAEVLASFGLRDPKGVEIDEDRLAAIVAQAAGLPHVKIDPLELDMELVTSTLSKPFALRHVVLPLTKDERGQLTVAVDNPFNHEVVEGLKRIHHGTVRRVVAAKRGILKSLTEIYGFRRSIDSAAKETHIDPLSDFEQLIKLRSLGEIEGTDKHVVNAVDLLLRYAFDQRASDVHVEPRREDSQVRLRIDGVLHNVHTYPRRVHPAIVSRIKTVARMDIAEKRRPQDGRIKTVVADKSVELRVSSMPTAFGEKLVIRIFDPEVLLRDLPDLGFDKDDLTTFEGWLQEPHGIILVTGPTGSGKTTTLYTALKTLASEAVNVTSVEDPIEMVTDAFNQVAVQPKVGLDFASAMRTILRQDPDIIMVGEIRDEPTAAMGIQAALTGHLVLSTLHTNDTLGAITRLVDLRVPHYLVSSTVVGVMAQRLVRRVCEACRTTVALTPEELTSLGVSEDQLDRFAKTATGEGCPECRGTGYLGRVGIFEMLDVGHILSGQSLQQLGEEKLRRLALDTGMRTLRQCALDRLAQGATSYQEIVRVTGLS